MRIVSEFMTRFDITRVVIRCEVSQESNLCLVTIYMLVYSLLIRRVQVTSCMRFREIKILKGGFMNCECFAQSRMEFIYI